VSSAQVKAGKLSVSFIVPLGWKVGQSGDKVVLQSADFSGRIELAVSSDKRKQPDAGSVRSYVLKEFGWTTPLGSAQAVESEQAGADNLRLRTFEITIPQPDGTAATLTLVANPEKYSQHQRTLQTLASSLRAQ
jgi:hypothetical protein